MALESLKIQHAFHIKYIRLVAQKKVHYEKYKNAIDVYMRKQENSTDTEKTRIENSCELQSQLFASLENADKLLDLLSGKTISANETIDIINGREVKSSEGNVVAELKKVYQDVHSVVAKLITQLDDSNRETQTLHEQLKRLEIKVPVHQNAVPYQNNDFGTSDVDDVLSTGLENVNIDTVAQNTSIQLMTSSSGDDTEENNDLPPLEMPTFDFNTGS